LWNPIRAAPLPNASVELSVAELVGAVGREQISVSSAACALEPSDPPATRREAH
jgi:hypothetical protein